MESSTINRGGLLGGVGLFLFGMKLFEETIKQTGKSRLKHTLKTYTNTLPKGVIAGMLQTFVFQSSTVVTMITLGFVGAGILGLYQALGVVLGANIGTTLTTWIVSLIGFKFKIEAYALPIVGISGLIMIMTDSNHIIHKICKMMIGFALLFMGLGYMKTSVDSVTQVIDLTQYATWGLAGFIGIGAILTAVIQTSTGVTILALTALSGGAITLDMGLGIVIGANIGSALSTGIMGLLSSSSTQHSKKQVSLTQILLNITTAIIVIPLVQPLKSLVIWILGPQDPELVLAGFHTLFNIILIIIRVPIMPRYARKIGHLFVQHNNHMLYSTQVSYTEEGEELLAAIRRDIHGLIERIKQYHLQILGPTGPSHTPQIIQLYNQIKADQKSLLHTIHQAKSHLNDGQMIQMLDTMNMIIMDACTSATAIKDILDHIDNIIEDEDNQGKLYYQSWIDMLQDNITNINEIPPHLDAMNALDHEKLLKSPLIKHRESLMKLVQSSQQDNEDESFVAEVIKTDYYLMSACQDLIRAIIGQSQLMHKFLES